MTEKDKIIQELRMKLDKLKGGVFINGVHAPIDCESCPFKSAVNCTPIYGGTIPAGCPVVEVI